MIMEKNKLKKIGNFFLENEILIDKIYSSEWCRCKETSLIAFKKFETKNFLNSFFSKKFAKNKDDQIIAFKNFINDWDGVQNLVFVTHYVVISEILNYATSSGEIVITNKDLIVIDTMQIAVLNCRLLCLRKSNETSTETSLRKAYK